MANERQERAAKDERSQQAESHSIGKRARSVDMAESRAAAARLRRKLSGRRHSDSAALIADDRRR
jgi:hypothetical protein